ncbi:MAG: Ig-like domain-containing protein [Gemmatimonadales bacterium]
MTVSPATATLVPQQTQTLTATTLDGSGNPLTGRTISWSTSAPGVATVSSAGVTTAVTPGAATIAATSEGKTGSAQLTVADGGQITSNGGTVEAAGGAVRIAVPAGATSAPVAITVASAARPTDSLTPGVYAVVGASYVFGPEGTTFSSAATVTVRYDPAKLPPWALPEDLALYHYAGGAWVKLPDLVVDETAHTVTASTTSFSPFAIGTRLPRGRLTPTVGSVNFIERSVEFRATIPDHDDAGLTYEWNTTGLNGAISPLFDNVALYTMTQSQLPLGDLDQVQVIIRGPIDPDQPDVLVPLASAEATVNADLAFSFEVNPEFSDVEFDGTKTFTAVVRDPSGGVYENPAGLDILKVWTSSQLHGDLDIHDPDHKTDVDHGEYTAKSASESADTPPRIDQISVDFYIGYMKQFTTTLRAFGFTRERVDSTVARYDFKHGTASGFVEVEKNTLLGNFTVRIPPGEPNCRTADALIKKVEGATSYELTVTGIINSSLGTTIHKTVTGPTSMGNILDVYDGGSFWGVPLDGGCNSIPEFAASRAALYQTQFGNAVFKVTTMP